VFLATMVSSITLLSVSLTRLHLIVYRVHAVLRLRREAAVLRILLWRAAVWRIVLRRAALLWVELRRTALLRIVLWRTTMLRIVLWRISVLVVLGGTSLWRVLTVLLIIIPSLVLILVRRMGLGTVLIVRIRLPVLLSVSLGARGPAHQ